ncbi:MAG: Nif11-like leader peptide family natural product precursor [Spirochaetia bacterium]|nr:Nif11-like leader peptide family natural product precursor [Spirochaetia bacterium]MBR4436307.1 Nif11-like leader peptide family natural product precursor [Spirochaetales bacterium]MBR4797045.1 Nif11-like leader peptide family natural product precursor [Spirochaetia bacterium]MBR5017702.1 Nif11-like leader peptide family natural product precursor [Spirochaetia bacterium]MBR5915484.1 Nif11-like leader peptide family natural product precursor [Spirochaetia bacterium]
MPIDKSKITKEMMEKAAKCETAEQLIALAKTEGFEITKAEAEAYLTEIDNMELDSESLDKVAGGGCYGDNPCGNFWIA